jgi:hypothetical protein
MVLGFGLAAASALCGNCAAATEQESFDALLEADWREVFVDSGTENWEDKWMLDGKHASLTNDEAGMHFEAGPTIRDDAHHAVLWTKESFQGDIRMDYDYTKTDDTIRNVTILYVQATGSGEAPFLKDISKWNELREVPAMRMYFNHMDTHHISYAAFGTRNEVQGEDYIRARRYMPLLNNKMVGTDLKPDYFRTGLFAQGVAHKITVIRKGRDLYMWIRNSEQDYLCHWNNDTLPEITEGRVGLRHMYSRGARYRDIRISLLKD